MPPARALPATLAALGALAASLGGCASNHRVSPFPDVDAALLLAPRRDLEGQLARAEAEASRLGLREALRVEGKLASGDRFVALGLEGRDPLGRPITAVRVVTPAAIVLALGPPRLADERPDEPRRLRASLGPEGAFPSGSDMTGDGAPDIALEADDGGLAVYRVDLQGATRYPAALPSPATRVDDVNGDGRPDLLSAAPVPPGDPIAPALLDVAIATPQAFEAEHPDAVAFHRRLADAPAPASAQGGPADRLRRALERAFHAARAGTPPAQAFQPAADLAAELAPLPEPLSGSWVRWRGWMADHLVKR